MIKGILIIGFLHRKLKNTGNLRYDVPKQPMITKSAKIIDFYREKMIQSIDDGIDIEDWFPVFP